MHQSITITQYDHLELSECLPLIYDVQGMGMVLYSCHTCTVQSDFGVVRITWPDMIGLQMNVDINESIATSHDGNWLMAADSIVTN